MLALSAVGPGLFLIGYNIGTGSVTTNGQNRRRTWHAAFLGIGTLFACLPTRILGLVGVLFCFGMQLMDQRPIVLMVFSQAFQASILPAVAIPILVLINRPDVMGEHRARWPLNLGLVGATIFSLVTTYFAIVEAVPLVQSSLE